MTFKTLLAAAALTVFALPASAQDAGDPAAGEKVFAKCKACHAIGEGAKIKVGPVLNGVIGRPAASYEGYKYSPALTAKAPDIAEWEEAEIFVYLEDPTAFIGGRSKMTFKLKKEDERRNVIAYLRQFDKDGNKAP